jgi:glycosyltransferase involved in cell wall biosynthesis
VDLLLAILHSNIVFVWFAAGQGATAAFVFAKALRKKIIFVAGGSEVAADRSIYGRDPRTLIRFSVARIIMRFVDCVIPVSEFTLKEVLSISAPRRYRVVHNAIDAHKFTSNHSIQKQPHILTVSGMRPKRGDMAIWVKGLDRYARLGQLLPDFKLHVIGSACSDPRVRSLFSSGICVGQLPQSELVPFYQKAMFYCQLSRYESFGMAVAEAMACECVPVVSDCGALPELVGDSGIIVPEGAPAIAAQLIQASLPRVHFLGKSARKRILSKFSVERRSRELRNVILTLCKEVK